MKIRTLAFDSGDTLVETISEGVSFDSLGSIRNAYHVFSDSGSVPLERHRRSQ